MHPIRETLVERFGFEEFLPGQEEVIEKLLAGRSAAAVFPTGGGKSICYQLPALHLEGLTLVVSPLIALMKDQVDRLRCRGIAAAQLDSTLDREDYLQLMSDLRSGGLRMLYVAPERFNNERFREVIAGLSIALMAVDEAHCISEWGHNFRPDYLKLAGYARELGAERVLALTATATPRVLDDICAGFDIDRADAVRTPFFRANLALRFTPVTVQERPEVLLDRLARPDRGSSIVYVTLQRTAEEVAARLVAAGVPARAYHAGMKSEARTEVQEWFMSAPDGVVVATIAFGMGIDKPDIRQVIHYNVSKSLESYAQEIGRAGRDGEPSVCETLLAGDDLCTLENFAYGDTPDQEAVAALVDDLFSRDEHFDISRTALSNEHDIRALVLATLLTYLELDGYLEGGTPFYSTYRFRPLATSQEILAEHEGEAREILAGIFRAARKRSTWFDVDFDACAAKLGQPRERLIRAMDYLHDRGQLVVEASGVRNRYRIVRQPDRPQLAALLTRRTHAREESEIARLRELLELAAGDECVASALGQHFGEAPLETSCSICSTCQSSQDAGMHQGAALPERVDPPIDAAVWARAEALRAETPVLASPRSFTRFLCGLSSPRLSRAKHEGKRLVAHPLYGAFAHVPFATVLSRAGGD